MPFIYFSLRRNHGRWMNRHSERAGKPPDNLLPHVVHPDAHDDRRKPRPIVNHRDTGNFRHQRIIINKGRDFSAAGLNYLFYHFTVTACTKKIHS